MACVCVQDWRDQRQHNKKKKKKKKKRRGKGRKSFTAEQEERFEKMYAKEKAARDEMRKMEEEIDRHVHEASLTIPCP
jgi:hypothetical protein